jgi:hypothetical protein
MVEWSLVPDTDGIPATGYLLLIDDGYSGDFFVAFDGSNQPQTYKTLIVGLTTGLPYRLMVIAENINGNSTSSDITTMYACLNPSFN